MNIKVKDLKKLLNKLPLDMDCFEIEFRKIDITNTIEELKEDIDNQDYIQDIKYEQLFLREIDDFYNFGYRKDSYNKKIIFELGDKSILGFTTLTNKSIENMNGRNDFGDFHRKLEERFGKIYEKGDE